MLPAGLTLTKFTAPFVGDLHPDKKEAKTNNAVYVNLNDHTDVAKLLVEEKADGLFNEFTGSSSSESSKKC